MTALKIIILCFLVGLVAEHLAFVLMWGSIVIVVLVRNVATYMVAKVKG